MKNREEFYRELHKMLEEERTILFICNNSDFDISLGVLQRDLNYLIERSKKNTLDVYYIYEYYKDRLSTHYLEEI